MYGQQQTVVVGVTTGGIGFGAALAMAISYSTNAHIGWAVLHGLCGWFYVLYCLLGFGRP